MLGDDFIKIELLICLKDRNLLLGSSILEEYPQVKKFLDETPNKKSNEINTLEPSIKRIFENNLHKSIIKQANQEWKINKTKTINERGTNIKNCQLCNTPIKKPCWIINRINGNEMIIGSSCINHFELINKKDLDAIFKEREIIIRKEDISKRINKIESIIGELDVYLEKIPIIVKEDVIKEFMKLRLEVKKIYSKYIEENLTEEEKRTIVERIKVILKLLNNEKLKIDEYVDIYKNHKLVLTKEIFNSIKCDYHQKKELKKEGFILEKFMFRIRSLKFMNSISNILNTYLEEYNMKIESVQEPNYYKIKLNGRIPIIVDYKYSDFMFNYSSLIYKQELLEEINHKNILENSVIKDKKSISTIVGCMDDEIHEYDFEVVDINFSFNEIRVYNLRTEKYYILDLKDSINKFKYIVTDEHKEYEKKVIDYVRKCTNIKNKNEMKHYMLQTNI